MTGFILAAGFGTRLNPITRYLPKALVSVAGKPLLARSLQFLKNQGFSRIGVNSHYLSGQLEEFREKSPVAFEIFHEEKIRGTGGALYFARDFLSCDDLFFVLNVDIVCQIELGPVIDFFKNSSFSCLLIAFPAPHRKGTVLFDRESAMYLGTPAENPVYPNACGADFIGAALYKNEFLSLLTEDDFSIVPVWSRASQKGMKTGVYLMKNGYWRDIGTPQSLAQVHFDVIGNVVILDVPDYISINTDKRYAVPYLISGQNFSNLEDAWVESESIGAESVISRSVIFQNCTIDNRTAISNSLVTPWGVICLDK
ncbi:MAG TPA: sugar phosphate nucleotidyltransferase [Chitinispirillaceae bacterium]|nr:sugar phosphate nucleotidyltransferase [Chitinispirillaceae bacterium]